MNTLEDQEENEPDDFELENLEDERMAECICGAYQFSDKKKHYIQIADCICGRV